MGARNRKSPRTCADALSTRCRTASYDTSRNPICADHRGRLRTANPERRNVLSEHSSDLPDRPLTPYDEDWHSIVKTDPETRPCLGCGGMADVHCTLEERHSIRAAREDDVTLYMFPLCQRCAGMGRVRAHLIERFVMNNLDKCTSLSIWEKRAGERNMFGR